MKHIESLSLGTLNNSMNLKNYLDQYIYKLIAFLFFTKQLSILFHSWLTIKCSEQTLAFISLAINTESNSKYTLELKGNSESCFARHNNKSLPMYSGKQIVKGDLVIFSANKSFLLRKSIMDVSVNHLLLQMESNSFMLSIIRFCKAEISIFKN